MRINYRTAISETEETLREQEVALRGKATAPRLRLLVLLKSGQAPSLRAAAPLVGFEERTLQTWWQRYRTGGLAAMLREPVFPGKRSQLTPAALAGLEAEMRAGRIATLRAAQAYLAEQWGIHYRSLNGVWVQLHRRGLRPKTGRRRHAKANAKQQAEYKSDVCWATPDG